MIKKSKFFIWLNVIYKVNHFIIFVYFSKVFSPKLTYWKRGLFFHKIGTLFSYWKTVPVVHDFSNIFIFFSFCTWLWKCLEHLTFCFWNFLKISKLIICILNSKFWWFSCHYLGNWDSGLSWLVKKILTPQAKVVGVGRSKPGCLRN